MLYPSIFRNDLFDDIFDDFVKPFPARGPQSMVMKTDIKETTDAYQLDVELPGVKKENVSVELKDGALNIKAISVMENNEDKKEGRYIRRERFYGSCSRSFYVGDEVTKEDIKAKFENGVLTLMVPKIEAKPQIEEKQFISIE